MNLPIPPAPGPSAAATRASILESYVSDPKNDGTYILNLNNEQTLKLWDELDKAIAAAVAEATRGLKQELNQLGQALREADAMISHIDRTLYPGWTNLSRLDIKRGMELVEARIATEYAAKSSTAANAKR